MVKLSVELATARASFWLGKTCIAVAYSVISAW
jgi:hypothetical protein